MYEHVIMVRDTKLDPTAKLVAFALASRADESGHAWPSLETLIYDTGLSRASVKRGLSGLAASGLAALDRKKGQAPSATFIDPPPDSAAARWLTQRHRKLTESQRWLTERERKLTESHISNKKLKEGAPASVHNELQRLANEKAGLLLADPRDEDTIRDVQARIDRLLKGEP